MAAVVEASTTPDLMAVIGSSRDQVKERIDGLMQHGPEYMRRYAEWYLCDRGTSRVPRAPAGLDLEMAKVVRDVVIDQALAARTGARRVS